MKSDILPHAVNNLKMILPGALIKTTTIYLTNWFLLMLGKRFNEDVP